MTGWRSAVSVQEKFFEQTTAQDAASEKGENRYYDANMRTLWWWGEQANIIAYMNCRCLVRPISFSGRS